MTRSERLMAGLCHLTIFIPLWGAFAPLLVWMVGEKDDSQFRHDMLATTIFQAGQAITTLIFGILAMGIFLIGIVPYGVSIGNQTDSGAMIVFAGMMLLVFFLTLLSLMVQIGFQTLGIIAAVKTWRGEAYAYPLVGRLMKKH